MPNTGIDVNNFLDLVRSSDLPYLILFWGNGCSPCAKIKPLFEKFSQSIKSRTRARFTSFQTSENYKLASYFQVMAVPTLIAIRQDMTIKKLTGPKTLEDLQMILEDIYGS